MRCRGKSLFESGRGTLFGLLLALASLPALADFILPGGGPAAAACHLARTIVRRAERRTKTLADAEPVRAEALRYLNRLSDLLFVHARVIARAESGQEVLWNRTRDQGA